MADVDFRNMTQKGEFGDKGLFLEVYDQGEETEIQTAGGGIDFKTLVNLLLNWHKLARTEPLEDWYIVTASTQSIHYGASAMYKTLESIVQFAREEHSKVMHSEIPLGDMQYYLDRITYDEPAVFDSEFLTITVMALRPEEVLGGLCE